MNHYAAVLHPGLVLCILLRRAGQQHGGLRFAWGKPPYWQFPIHLPRPKLPPHVSLPFNPLSLLSRSVCISCATTVAKLLFFPACHICLFVFSSNNFILMRGDDVKICWSVLICAGQRQLCPFSRQHPSFDLLSVFYPQIPIISADHLSSHKYLTQM